MADVFELTFVSLAAVKSIDVQLDYGWAAAVAWLFACVAAARHRVGWAAVAVLAFGFWAFADGQMASSHAVLIGLVGLVLAVNVEADRLLWSQTVALYLFATLNKVNADYLSGSSVASRADWLPALPVAAAVGVAVEGWLAWAVWRRSRWALPVAAPLHGGIVVLMGRNAYEWLLLGSFNAMAVLLVWRSTSDAWVMRTPPGSQPRT